MAECLNKQHLGSFGEDLSARIYVDAGLRLVTRNWRCSKMGEIDLILTKSISRFARNTVDCLSEVRKLREANVEVFFEKEHNDQNSVKKYKGVQKTFYSRTAYYSLRGNT